MKTQFVNSKKSIQLTDKIKNAIEIKEWTVKQFAETMKVDVSTARRWLSGNHNFQVNVLFAMEDQLDIELINLQLQS